MNYKSIIDERFIKPLLDKKTGNIGVELEFPMLNLAKKPVEKDVAFGLLDMFLQDGFKVEETDCEGKPAFITNKDGDCISFDNSYNNIEFSMNYGDNLIDIKNRFYILLKKAQSYLKPKDYIITGMGTNPYKKHIIQSHVNYPVYNMVDKYLHEFKCEDTHDYPEFPSYLSSVQTHLDIAPQDLPKTATLFAKIDFLRGLLFSNSPDFDFGKTICYRDYLWQKSAFGLCNKNTGAVDEVYENLDDIASSFYERSMFNRIKNGEYECFAPILIKDYFDDNSPDDIKQFLSFRHIEITCRGTLEIRSDCAQPLIDALIPPAFNLGIAHNIDNAIKRTNQLFGARVIKNSYLRECVSSGMEIKEFSIEELKSYAPDMVNISIEGLKARNKGEESILQPLLKRAEQLYCPAKYILDNKDNIDNVITEYAKI